MAAGITPKSKIRQIQNISIGYGEIPVTTTPEGKKAWGLPGRGITYCIEEAKTMAKQLDAAIRQNLGHPSRPVLL